MEPVNHQWQIAKQCNEEKISENQQNKCCVVVIGTTGVGKSSLIKLFCGNSVESSDSVKSCTKDCSVFVDKQATDIQWMDTQGTDDNEMKDDDETVLKKTFKALYDQNTSKIKLIWIISGDMDRARGEYQKQAKFINLFCENEKHKIWESCLIIHKKGMIQPKLDSIKGAMAAAQQFGSKIQFEGNDQNQKKHLFGYTCLEWTKPDDPILKLLNMLPTEIQSKTCKEYGYLTGNEIKQKVYDKLNKLPELNVKFLNEECVKCGVKGDHRFITDPCHTKSKFIHTQQLENYHSGPLQWQHTQGTYEYPSVSYSSRTEYYHPKGCTFTCAIWGNSWDYDCCGKHRGDDKPRGCKSRIITTTPHTSYTTKYRCCDRSTGSSGCTQVHQCCNMISGAVGCKQRYKCCKKDPLSTGCTEVCDLCQVEWGKGPGCQNTFFME